MFKQGSLKLGNQEADELGAINLKARKIEVMTVGSYKARKQRSRCRKLEAGKLRSVMGF